MNLEALTDIRLLADLGMGVIALVLVIWVSRYARRHGIELRADSPAHKCLDDYYQNPLYSHLPSNAFHIPKDD